MEVVGGGDCVESVLTKAEKIVNSVLRGLGRILCWGDSSLSSVTEPEEREGVIPSMRQRM